MKLRPRQAWELFKFKKDHLYFAKNKDGNWSFYKTYKNEKLYIKNHTWYNFMEFCPVYFEIDCQSHWKDSLHYKGIPFVNMEESVINNPDNLLSYSCRKCHKIPEKNSIFLKYGFGFYFCSEKCYEDSHLNVDDSKHMTGKMIEEHKTKEDPPYIFKYFGKKFINVGSIIPEYCLWCATENNNFIQCMHTKAIFCNIYCHDIYYRKLWETDDFFRKNKQKEKEKSNEPPTISILGKFTTISRLYKDEDSFNIGLSKEFLAEIDNMKKRIQNLEERLKPLQDFLICPSCNNLSRKDTFCFSVNQCVTCRDNNKIMQRLEKLEHSFDKTRIDIQRFIPLESNGITGVT